MSIAHIKLSFEHAGISPKADTKNKGAHAKKGKINDIGNGRMSNVMRPNHVSCSSVFSERL
jgi:hypothetical protein